MGRLQDKVVIITGAASGFGREMAILFSKEGAKILAADISAKIYELPNMVEGEIETCINDVTKIDQVKEMVGLCKEKFGRLDVLCSNAGISSMSYLTHEIPIEEFDRIYDINVKGSFYVIREGLKLMLESGGGSIINTCSRSAYRASIGQMPYASSKSAVLMMTTNIAAEYAKQNIRVNSICPSVFETEMISRMDESAKSMAAALVPMGRLGKPIEMANLALFLASDESSYITGQNILIDGGSTCF